MLNTDTKSKARLGVPLVTAICLMGLVLRVYFFGINRSLWLDEAMLALNIVNRSFLDLLKPLDMNQGAPIGFLVLQKIMVSLLGNSDYTLRVIPLMAGVVSIPIMYLVSKQYLEDQHFFIPLGLFVLSPRLIYYSSELKQYSTDVLTALVLLFLASECFRERASSRALVFLGGAGVLGIWFSHPSVFLLSAIFLSIGLDSAIKRDSVRLSWLIGVGVAWAISFVLVYLVSLRYLEANSALLNFWNGSFAPLPIWGNFRWYYNALIGMLRDPATLPMNAFVVGLLIIGVFSLLRKWQLVLILLIPFSLTLVASGLRRYPFNGRFLLFLLPLLFLLLAEGVKRARIILLRVNKHLARLIYASSVVYLFYGPVNIVYNDLQSPPMGEHIKPVLAYLHENRLSTDLSYVYYGAIPAFEFYRSLYGFDHSDYIIYGVSSREKPDKYLEDVEKLRGNQRVWFIFSHSCSSCIVNEEEYILEHLSKIGIKRDKVLSYGTSLYLYDLRRVP